MAPHAHMWQSVYKSLATGFRGISAAAHGIPGPGLLTHSDTRGWWSFAIMTF